MESFRRRSAAAASGQGDKPSSEHAERAEGEGPDADPYSVARKICLRLLTDRARSRAELVSALAKRHVPSDVSESVLERLSELGFIDDEVFAQSWVRSRHAGRGLARRTLAHELRARGVDEATVAAAVADLDEADEAERAAELISRKLGASRGLPVETRARRLIGMLARKGYPGGLAARLVRDALAREKASDDADAPADGVESWAEIGE